ncbi:hypothetical protein B5X24_HaOG202677 [Helicoverpa armigera]|uniref:Kazal-like domain-containing protein n=1 Tax=Helicoverpa armigera TaxID=29058 RepID=A0A2W1BWI1_HELAM|nr:hypothetical protein B5X24_HaOG202677 [Helicoverpa armigera]
MTVIFLVFVWHSETTKECYQAKICFHDAIEKCGIDEKGTLRRFLDSCDIMEYNCYYNGTYAKTDPASCIGQALQSLFRQRPYDDGDMKYVNNHWCRRAKICHKMVGHPVCGVDPKRRQKRMFKNACSLYKHNCGRMQALIALSRQGKLQSTYEQVDKLSAGRFKLVDQVVCDTRIAYDKEHVNEEFEWIHLSTTTKKPNITTTIDLPQKAPQGKVKLVL